MKENKKDFCLKCEKMVNYTYGKRKIIQNIRDKDYEFEITTAYCNDCGEEMTPHGLIDKNIKEIDEQYRDYESLIKIEDIYKLMDIYKIGKEPLSLVLGFGQVTINRYLAGQIPSKEYSGIIRSALCSPEYMELCLKTNKKKISKIAYEKSMEAVKQMESLFVVSDKMLNVIDYIFEKIKEITPLALQKLLYFIQSESYVLYDKPMFKENALAWVHGPVYEGVYNLFKDFTFNPINDPRFAMLSNRPKVLSEDEKIVIDLVLDTYGIYSGKVLEEITHIEYPWVDARKGLDKDERSNVIIDKESIRDYYQLMNDKYSIDTKEGLNKYIKKVLKDIERLDKDGK